jgi:hypothetical protein
MERARISQRGSAHGIPIGAGAHAIDLHDTPASACTGFRHHCFPKIVRQPLALIPRRTAACKKISPQKA